MNRGFTLVELLIVLLIIGILLSFSLSALVSTRKSSRDAKRKADLVTYASVLEHYHADNGNYPGLTYNNSASCNSTGIFATGPIIPTYLASKIDDPSSSPSCPKGCGSDTWDRCSYRYTVSTDQSSYVLSDDMEMSNVWQVCSNGKTGEVPRTICESAYGTYGNPSDACRDGDCDIP